MSPTPLLILALSTLAAHAVAEVDYVRDIKPLLKAECVKCHGRSTQKAGLRLDTAAHALRGGERGPAVTPGHAETSLLLQAVKGTHAELPQMPYKRLPLDPAKVRLLEGWIESGADAPNHEQPSDDRHWAYIPPIRPQLPKTEPAAAHPIDAFVRVALSTAELKPAPRASHATLVRRLHLDLTGLPPSPTILANYAKASDKELTELADDLLSSPHYGERWGRWWLDQARYADSNGYSIDAPRSIWPYRDWVISAFNADKPYDEFTVEQLAGDLLKQPKRDQLIATGFHRNTQINQEGGIDKEQFRIESVFDRVATTGTVWLGLTVGCAQCHDHKFDAISHQEYFQLFAFFNDQEEPTLPLPELSGSDRMSLEKERVRLEAKVREYLGRQVEAIAEWETGLTESLTAKLSKGVRSALVVAKEQRTISHQRALFSAGPGAADQEFRALNEKLTGVEKQLQMGVTTLVMKEAAQPRQTRLFIKGDFTRPAEQVEPGVPAALPALHTESRPTRLDLARWLVSRDNPLTARVLVNRVWQQYFGRGLVETENDFGTMGSLPSHPELLDWLAVEFMDSGWSMKHLHRLIVTSETYRQSSAVGEVSSAHMEKAAAVDPNNYLLWRQNRLRLDAEIVRDVCLTASGLLSPKLGGPPVYPPIPEGVLSLGQVKRTWPLSRGEDRYRRGLYTFIFRATPPPALAVFDGPDGFSSCTRRLRSNTPLQALTLLNDAAFSEFATALAKIVERDGAAAAFERCTSRQPTAAEMAILEPLNSHEVARALLNLDETITRE